MVMERVHFEKHGIGAQFVDLEHARKSVRITWGRLGKQGLTRMQELPTEKESRVAFLHQVKRLERKGFVAGHHNETLLRAIQQTPDSSAAYLVYSDWLHERGDPRGALISSMATGNREETERLLNAHPVLLRPNWWSTFGVKTEWRLGFVHHFVLPGNHAEKLERILVHPSCIAVRRLTLQGPWSFNHTQMIARLKYLPPTVSRLIFTMSALPGGATLAKEALAQYRLQLPNLVVE